MDDSVERRLDFLQVFLVLDKGVPRCQRIHVGNNDQPTFVHTSVVVREFLVFLFDELDDFFGT